MRILVTGAAGFIGFHTAKRFLEEGHSVVGIDSINSYYDPELKFARLNELGIGRQAETWGTPVQSGRYPEFSFIRMKLEDRAAMESLFKKGCFDRVIHLAAQAGVRYSLDHPHEYIDSNIVGFLNILEGCRHGKVEHLIYASSSSVYGNSSEFPFKESANVDYPISLYAATKKSNELMAYTYSHLYGLKTTGLRFFTVYGPWGRPDMAYFKFTKAILEGKPISVYNHGDLYRDFTYIDDIVEGISRIVQKAHGETYKIFNIGNNNPIQLNYYIQVLETVLGKKAMINYEPMQPGDVYRTGADISTLEHSVDWKPSTDISVGLTSFFEWYVVHYKTYL
ncbi:MAG: NAD-dependent epimerase/dehydratase family protein [bacterium]